MPITMSWEASTAPLAASSFFNAPVLLLEKVIHSAVDYGNQHKRLAGLARRAVSGHLLATTGRPLIPRVRPAI